MSRSHSKHLRNKVLFIGFLNYSSNSADINRLNNYAKALALKNVQVYFLTIGGKTRGSFSSFEEKGSNIFISRVNKAKILNIKTYMAVLYLFEILNLNRNNKGTFSVLFYPNLQFSMIVIVRIIQLLTKIPIFIEINELRELGIKETLANMSNSNWIQRAKKRFQHSVFKSSFHYSIFNKAKGLICISTRLEMFYKKYNDNTIRVPILSEISSNGKLADREKFYNAKLPFKICFAGIITNQKEFITEFIHVLARLNKMGYQIEFDLFGAFPLGNSQMLFEKWLNENEYNTFISYKGKVSHDELIEIYKQYHALFLLRKDTEQNNFGFSTKLASYLTSGIPIITTLVSDMELYLQDNVNCFIFDHDVNTFEWRLKEVIDRYNSLASNISAQAFRTAKTFFDYRLYADDLKSFILK